MDAQTGSPENKSHSTLHFPHSFPGKLGSEKIKGDLLSGSLTS